jgi:hypothetical protein
MTLRFEVDATAATAELDRLSRGADPAEFEEALVSGVGAVSAKVHVITTRLRTSGHSESEFSGGRWEGTIGFARDPGIFELARGDSPTANHPEGGHFFMNPGGEQFCEQVRQSLIHYVTGGEGDIG